MPQEVNPKQAFDRLFDVSASKADRSILDFVLDSSKRVRQQISYDDRDKLDQYMTSVREIEQRIDSATSSGPPAAGSLWCRLIWNAHPRKS